MITQSMIIELREKTGAGVMNCRNTLNETNGDLEKAIAILKEKGLAIAASKAERTTAEGLIGVYISEDHKTGGIVEVNCETDFVAVNREFIDLVNNLAKQAAKSMASHLAEFMDEKYQADESLTIQSAVTSLVAKLRENISIRRFKTFSTRNGFIQSYLHNGGRIGVLVELASEKERQLLTPIGKEIAMQIAAIKPLFIDPNSIEPEILNKVRQSIASQALSSGKPKAVVEKIVSGKIGKYFKEYCLLEQAWIKNEEITITDYLHNEAAKLGANIQVIQFVRFERSEELENHD